MRQPTIPTPGAPAAARRRGSQSAWVKTRSLLSRTTSEAGSMASMPALLPRTKPRFLGRVRTRGQPVAAISARRTEVSSVEPLSTTSTEAPARSVWRRVARQRAVSSQPFQARMMRLTGRVTGVLPAARQERAPEVGQGLVDLGLGEGRGLAPELGLVGAASERREAGREARQGDQVAPAELVLQMAQLARAAGEGGFQTGHLGLELGDPAGRRVGSQVLDLALRAHQARPKGRRAHWMSCQAREWRT